MVPNLILEAGVERVAPTSAGVDAQSLEVLVNVVRCHAGKLARSVHVKLRSAVADGRRAPSVAGF